MPDMVSYFHLSFHQKTYFQLYSWTRCEIALEMHLFAFPFPMFQINKHELYFIYVYFLNKNHCASRPRHNKAGVNRSCCLLSHYLNKQIPYSRRVIWSPVAIRIPLTEADKTKRDQSILQASGWSCRPKLSPAVSIRRHQPSLLDLLSCE